MLIGQTLSDVLNPWNTLPSILFATSIPLKVVLNGDGKLVPLVRLSLCGRVPNVGGLVGDETHGIVAEITISWESVDGRLRID